MTGAPTEQTKVKTIKQSELTSECWLVQFWGGESCKTCEFLDTDECGGQAIRETGENSKGIPVPLGTEMDG